MTTMIDKQKVQQVIQELLEYEALGIYAQHNSSALEFDAKLKEHGITSPIEICHEYKFPKGFDEASFERYNFQQIWIHLFDADRVINPEKYLQKFYDGTDVPECVQRERLAELLKVTGALSAAEREYVADYFKTEQPKALPRMAAFLPEIKRLNPEIADINPVDAFDFHDLYIGMTSRFHPDDIKYFMGLSFEQHDQVNQDHSKLAELLGFDVGFRLSPARRQQLIDVVLAQRRDKTGVS